MIRCEISYLHVELNRALSRFGALFTDIRHGEEMNLGVAIPVAQFVNLVRLLAYAVSAEQPIVFAHFASIAYILKIHPATVALLHSCRF